MFRRSTHPGEHEKIASSALAHLPMAKAPDAIRTAIEASLDAPKAAAVRVKRPSWRWALLPATILLLYAITWSWYRVHRVRWDVVRVSGSLAPRSESIGAGEWLQTDASSRAEVRVGTIGTVEVEPDTRLRVVTTRPNEHRLLLERGEIAATISAPPKLFFVETRSATAVDLGCQYRMNVDDKGNGLLRVTLGWVSFDWQGRESLVPAGANCRTRAGTGPGTPFFEDAAKDLVAALDDFDFSGGGASALRTILDSARPRDTLTLWHLLARVDVSQRPLVYERMVSFAAPPSGVTRDKVLTLDPQTLKVWKDELAWSW
jgi:hypothetical protein